MDLKDDGGSTPPFILPPELTLRLATPGTLTDWTGQRVRHLYAIASRNFVPQRDLSIFGFHVFTGNLDAVKQEYERSHPDLRGTETCFQTGYVSIAVIGSQRLNLTNTPVFCSHAKVIAYLILNGAPVDVPDIVGRRALHHLASDNRVANVLNALFMGNPDPNSRERYGTTPLHSAIMNSQAEVVDLCLAKGGDLYAKEGDGITPVRMLPFASPAVNAIVAKHCRQREGITALMGAKGTCIACGKTCNLMQCTRCRIARYCGQECQRIHWNNGHSHDCVPFHATKSTLSFKPSFIEQLLVIPHSEMRRASGIAGQPDATALRQAEQIHLKDGSEKSSVSRHADFMGRPFILKVQITTTPEAEQFAGMLVYNKSREFACNILPAEQPTQFSILEKKIRESGCMGFKGYFTGVLVDEQRLDINVKDILPVQPW